MLLFGVEVTLYLRDSRVGTFGALGTEGAARKNFKKKPALFKVEQCWL
jgi:hypothetical protein